MLGFAAAKTEVRVLLPALILAASTLAEAPRTLRLDYFHTGTSAEERFALDGVALEGPWPGRLDKALDDTNLGKYFFEVVDARSGRAHLLARLRQRLRRVGDDTRGEDPRADLPRVAALSRAAPRRSRSS